MRKTNYKVRSGTLKKIEIFFNFGILYLYLWILRLLQV